MKGSSFTVFDGDFVPEYVLMNKNVEIASFAIHDKLNSIHVIRQFTQLPYWIDDLDVFIQNRRAPKHREYKEDTKYVTRHLSCYNKKILSGF